MFNLSTFGKGKSGGFTTQSIAGGAQTTALSVSDGSTGATLAHKIIEFTGTLTAGRNVTIPIDVQQFYILKNGISLQIQVKILPYLLQQLF